MQIRRRVAIALVASVISCVCAGVARAQEAASRPDFSRAPLLETSMRASLRASIARAEATTPARPDEPGVPGRSKLMWTLYASTAIVQALDTHSTIRAIDAGAVERNPAMSYFSRHRPAFIAVKAGSAAGLIYVGRRLAKRNKLQAAIALIAIDSAYVAIAAHNYRVGNRLRR